MIPLILSPGKNLDFHHLAGPGQRPAKPKKIVKTSRNHWFHWCFVIKSIVFCHDEDYLPRRKSGAGSRFPGTMTISDAEIWLNIMSGSPPLGSDHQPRQPNNFEKAGGPSFLFDTTDPEPWQKSGFPSFGGTWPEAGQTQEVQENIKEPISFIGVS